MDTLDKQPVVDGNQVLRDTNRPPLAAVFQLPKTIFQRLYAGDGTAAKDCLDNYGSLVWTIAKKNLSSAQEAEGVTEKIFEDIWQYSRFNRQNEPERKIIEQIALRRIICHQWEGRNVL